MSSEEHNFNLSTKYVSLATSSLPNVKTFATSSVLKWNLILGTKIKKIYAFKDFLKQKKIQGRKSKTHELTGSN
jgi:hypothetical protein